MNCTQLLLWFFQEVVLKTLSLSHRGPAPALAAIVVGSPPSRTQHRVVRIVTYSSHCKIFFALVASAIKLEETTDHERVAMADAKKVYTLSEVSGHNNAQDCWLIINGKVYDVTKFLEDHPGGDEVLLSATGKDATDDFEDVGHSTSARDMMEEYLIGDIDPSTFPSKPSFTPAKQAAYNPDKSTEFLIKILQFVVPLAILALAVAVRYLTKNEDVKNN